MLILRCFTVFQKYPVKLTLFSDLEFQKDNLCKNPAIHAGFYFFIL